MLLRLLNEYTFVEFKSPTDSLESGDLLKFVACVLLWGDQQRERPPRKRISLVLLAPYINQALRDDARFLALKIRRQGPGLYRLTGLPFTIWLVETDAANPNDPVLMLMGRELLKHREESLHSLEQSGHEDLLKYSLQQIKQFQLRREEFAMQHSQTRHMDEMAKSLKEMVLEDCTTEERLHGVPAEKILQHLSDDEIAGALDPKRLQAILERVTKPASRPTPTKRKHR